MGLEYRSDRRPQRRPEFVMIYLASISPRRKSLLKKAGILYRVLRPRYEEGKHLKVPPARLVQIHAREKARSCAGLISKGVILAADTVVAVKGKIYGKPADRKEAFRMLADLQGRRQGVYTGVAILKVAKRKIVKETVFCEKSVITLKKMSRPEILRYFTKVNPLDKAGACSIQARGGLVVKTEGSFSNAVGLPMEKVVKLLKEC